MSVEELAANLDHFIGARRGPRSVACDTVVLSGLGGVTASGLPGVLEDARSTGLCRVVAHIGSEQDSIAAVLGGKLDVGVWVVSRPGPAIRRLGAARLHVAIPLRRHALDVLDAIVDRVIASVPDLVVLTWPFPGGALPPHASDCARPVESAIARLRAAGIQVGLKGLPLCALAPAAREPALTWRSGNRWYVDAEHQLDQALLFFPQVVHLARRDACRFCALTSRCDGVAEAWLDAGLVSLEPIPTEC